MSATNACEQSPQGAYSGGMLVVVGLAAIMLVRLLSATLAARLHPTICCGRRGLSY